MRRDNETAILFGHLYLLVSYSFCGLALYRREEEEREEGRERVDTHREGEGREREGERKVAIIKSTYQPTFPC